MKKNINKITLALVCHKEKEKLALILEDIKKQSAFKQIGEILLFQNGACKKTKQTASQFLSDLPLKIFSSTENNLGQARAFLVQKARFDWIAWTDSDCRLNSGWLETLINNWTEELVGLGGPNRLPEDKTWKKIFNLSLSVFIGHGFSAQAWRVKKALEVNHIPTSNGLFLKSAILAVGNFSKEHKFIGEDLELGLKLCENGKLVLFPEPLVINNFAESYFSALKRLFNFGSVQTHKNNRFFYILLLFFPLLSLCFILSFFSKLFLFLTLFYFLTLLFYSVIVLLKSKKALALLLPFFWLSQHCAYSLGANKRVLSFKKFFE